jgi:UPF0716 protein FxsA
MVAALFVIFVVLAVIELYVLVTVAGVLGVVPTIALLLLVSFCGAWLVKRQGVSVWARMQRTLQRGEVPAAEMVDGGLLLAAGSMLIVPGFVSDAFGLALLLPPVRHLVRNRLLARWDRGASTVFGRRVVDVEYIGDVTPRPSRPTDRPPELGSGR